MDIREPLSAAVRALKVNKLRSALTTLGIIIGVAAVIIVVSLVQGLKTSVLKQVEKAGSQTLFVRPIFPGELPPDEFARIKDRDLTLDHMRALAKDMPQLTHLTPVFFSSFETKLAGKTASTRVIMSDDSYLELNSVNIDKGRNFVPSDTRLASKVAIIGPSLMEKLGIQGNPIGRVIVVNGNLSLEIIGLLEAQGGSLGNDPDDVLMVPLNTGFSQLTEQQRRQLMFQARVDPRISADDGADMVTDALRRIKGLRGKQPNSFRVFSPKQITGIVSGITGTITAVAGGMVSIALLVGGIGIMNIMLVSVTERTREIGVRKAVGAKRRDVMLQFLIEAAFLCVMGGAIGVGLGFILGAVLGKALMGTMGSVPLWAVTSAFAVPAAIGLIFGLYPAAKASKLDPIEALRYE
ncbi:ABC transporter permease [Geothrix sp. PMB-07]|uniref:ABC transporter permease n=1 Tax=Geothrix sp. PMB-07 TaxID=3068640 RepID=UPI0027422AE3|nr:ABC transporter permease [Geothrix sp. PMB-07]WLT32429.1 ABC transporter permease [Geothrix sp. PMB-07]